MKWQILDRISVVLQMQIPCGRILDLTPDGRGERWYPQLEYQNQILVTID
jgi:hypothetical protein